MSAWTCRQSAGKAAVQLFRLVLGGRALVADSEEKRERPNLRRQAGVEGPCSRRCVQRIASDRAIDASAGPQGTTQTASSAD